MMAARPSGLMSAQARSIRSASSSSSIVVSLDLGHGGTLQPVALPRKPPARLGLEPYPAFGLQLRLGIGPPRPPSEPPERIHPAIRPASARGPWPARSDGAPRVTFPGRTPCAMIWSRTKGDAMGRFVGMSAVACLVGALLASPASAGETHGRIVFDSDRGGHVDLWVMNPDGSGQHKITDDKIEDLFPSWSPDGSKIVWTRGGRGPLGEIWVMSADGSGATQLTFNQFPDLNAKWSPDGSTIVFRSLRDRNADIYVMSADGTGEQRLTTDPAFDFSPDWSPNGTRIAFTR